MYNTENLCKVDKIVIQFTINDKAFLDFLLVKKRGKSISYSTVKKNKILKKEIEFEKRYCRIRVKVFNTDRRWFTNLHYFPTEKYFNNYVSMANIPRKIISQIHV